MPPENQSAGHLYISMLTGQGLATDIYCSSACSAGDTFIASQPGFSAWQILGNFDRRAVGQDFRYLCSFISELGSQPKFKIL